MTFRLDDDRKNNRPSVFRLLRLGPHYNTFIVEDCAAKQVECSSRFRASITFFDEGDSSLGHLTMP
jgi:hypothetical protein